MASPASRAFSNSHGGAVQRDRARRRLGLALKGLLAAEIWADRRARLHTTGQVTSRVTTRLADTANVEDFGLPLDKLVIERVRGTPGG
jgi:hypothetical protein